MQGTKTPLQRKASDAFACFETAFRDPQDDESSYVRVHDGSPEWVTDLVRHAHGDMLPDDYRYQWVMNALECIADCDDPEDAAHEWADGCTDIYTGQLLAWLSSNLRRVGYCDDAIRDGQWFADQGLVDLVSAGQYNELRETFELVWRWLEDSLKS